MTNKYWQFSHVMPRAKPEARDLVDATIRLYKYFKHEDLIPTSLFSSYEISHEICSFLFDEN
jgi:hypothetical protein